MILLSKTVVNHLKTNSFSTVVITFFAGCSAFVQLSTDNIRGIIDSSLAPFATSPKQDMFIKTGKKEAFMGGASFTLPVEIEIVKSEDVKRRQKRNTASTQKTEVRYLTPKGWFERFDGSLASDRLKKSTQSTASYDRDFCIPLRGIRSIYTDYWVRPKVRFKGVWDAQIVDENGKLKAKDNETYRKECAEYIEEEKIEEGFLSSMMWDWAISSTGDGWERLTRRMSNGKSGSEKGVSLFSVFKVDEYEKKRGSAIGAPSHIQSRINKKVSALVSEESNSGQRQEGENGARWMKKRTKGQECWSFDRRGRFKWERECKKDIVNDAKMELKGTGKIFGVTEKNKLHEIEGTEVSKLTGSEYINKYNERQKEKLKMEIEEILMNSEHLDIRKILEEFRTTKGGQIQQVSQDSSRQNSVANLWTPAWESPWLEKAKTREITQKTDPETMKKIYARYRFLQDNQLMKYNAPKDEKDMLKFNVHKSVQLTNTVNAPNVSSSNSPQNENKLIDTTGHTYKVIAYENKREWGSVNPLRIIKGNPLFVARENQEKLLRDFIAVYDQPFYSPWMIPMLRMISRAKFSGTSLKDEKEKKVEDNDVRKTLWWWIDYLQYPWRDKWNIPRIAKDPYDPVKYEKLQSWLEEISKYTWSSNGSRIIFNFTAYYRQYLISKNVFPAMSYLMKNFKMIGYIEQPTSYFTVVSPEYARIHGFEPISDEKYKEFRSLVNNLWLTQEDWEEAYQNFIKENSNKKHIVNIGDKQMIIVGLGLTPDLLYPVQSWITLQPDKNKEALVYVDEYGFSDLKERGTIKYQEQYVTIGLPENIKAKGREASKQYMKELREFIDKKLTGDNKNSYLLTMAGEDEGSDQLYSVRNAYVPAFQSRMGAVSYVLSSAVYVVVLILLLILIRKYLQSNMYLFGNFVANGMAKVNVLLNICLFTLIPLAVATTFGYLLSLAMQSSFYSIISSFWYLTTRMSTLGAGSSLYFIFKVLAFILPISYFYSRWALKDNVSSLLKTTASMKVNRLTLIVYKILYKLSAMWKFKSVLVFNTFGQSGILSLTSIVGFLFLNIFLHNHGLFTKVAAAEKAVKTHEYEIDFITPTKESGEYTLATYDGIGKKVLQESSSSSGSSSGSSTGQWIRKKREIDLLKSVYEQYKGYATWEKGEVEAKKNGEECKDKKSEQGTSYAWFKGLFCLTKTVTSGGDGHTRGDSVSSQAEEWKLMNGDTPVRKIQANKRVQGSRRRSRSAPQNGNDKYYSGDKEIYKKLDQSSGGSNSDSELPSLQDLIKNKYPNYWIISTQDQSLAETDMNFFKGKTLLRILLDLDFEYTSDSGLQKFNIWEQKSKELEKIQPMLKKMDEDNYDKFVQFLVRSRYGPLFVAKFMERHEVKSSSQESESSSTTSSSSNSSQAAQTTQSSLDKILSRQGAIYQGKKTYFFKGTDIGREEQATNIRKSGSNGGKSTCPNRELKKANGEQNGNNCESTSSSSRTRREAPTPKPKINPFEDGLYYVNSKKILFLNETKDVDKELIIIYNPEFLYLIITAVQEFAQEREKNINATLGLNGGSTNLQQQNGMEYVVPIKYTFGGIVHSHDATQSSNVQASAGSAGGGGSSEPEYYSSSMKGGEQDKFDPKNTPKGDQTYTWTKGKLSKTNRQANRREITLSDEIKILGLKEDKRGAFYKLYQGEKILNNLLYESGNSLVQKASTGGAQEPFPVLINRFTARKHGLGVGDTISFEPRNHFTRFTCVLKAKKAEATKPAVTSQETNGQDPCQEDSSKNQGKNGETHWKNTDIKPHTLKVVGIFDAYYKEAYFMSQKNVNKIIGLDEDKGFNGIFTPQRKSSSGKIIPPDQLSNALSSYSVSGLYTDIQHKAGNAALKNLLTWKAPYEKKKKEEKKVDGQEIRNYKIYENILGKGAIGYSEFEKQTQQTTSSNSSEETEAQAEGKATEAARQLVGRIALAYKEYPNPMNTALLALMNHNIVGDVVFKNLGNLTDNVSYLVIFVIFPLLLMSLITIVYLLIKDLENVFVTMKLLGFGNKENSMPIIVYLLFLLFFSSFIGSLIVPKVLNRYVDLLFNSQSILLPLVLSNGLMAGVFGILAVIYLFSIFKSYVKIKGIYLPVSIKLLVG